MVGEDPSEDFGGEDAVGRKEGALPGQFKLQLFDLSFYLGDRLLNGCPGLAIAAENRGI